MPIVDDAPGRRIMNCVVRAGQDVTVYVFPAGKFGQSEIVDGMPRPLGERRRGLVTAVEPVDCPGQDAQGEWVMPGVRVTFADGTVWDGVGHAFATWHGGVEPSVADLKATEAAESHMQEINDAQQAAYDAEGDFADFEVHPALSEDDEPVVMVHTPWDRPEDVPIMVDPEQAEAFALRLLQQATIVRLMRESAERGLDLSGFVAGVDETGDSGEGDPGER